MFSYMTILFAVWPSLLDLLVATVTTLSDVTVALFTFKCSEIILDESYRKTINTVGEGVLVFKIN